MFDRIASTLLFASAANGDNLTIGIAYGMKRRRIGWVHNLLIGVITTVMTLVALAAGRELRGLLPAKLPNVVGGILLISLAGWSSYRERVGAAERAAKSIDRFAARSSVGLGETIFLAGSLSISNIGLAIAGGIGGADYSGVAVAIFGLSIVMLTFGQVISTNIVRLTLVPRALRFLIDGNMVLALAGALMIAGY